jgi:dynactin 1
MLEDACQDLEGTIMQFRELVLQLQRYVLVNSVHFRAHGPCSELDGLRAETQTAQHESATAASQTAAMMSLNLKLQSSATKNQARNIELELRRIEAKEAREMLEIIQVRSTMDYLSGCILMFVFIAVPASALRRD